jgi:flagellar protein FlaG
MDINSIGGATPVAPTPQTPQQGRAPVAPVSRETLANNAGVSKGAADGGTNAPPVNMPVVAKEEDSATNWQRQPGVEAQETMGNQARRGQVASQANARTDATQESAFKRPLSTEEEKQAAQKELEEVKQSVEDLNEFILPYNSSINFSIDKESGRLVVKVIDNETKEVIKQIPSEEAVKLARSLEQLQGLLVRQQA